MTQKGKKKASAAGKKAESSKAAKPSRKSGAKAVAASTTFEAALTELETIVEQLESGEQSLDLSLTQFERGVSLARFCQQNLDDANHKIKVLIDETTDDGDDDILEDFDSAAR